MKDINYPTLWQGGYPCSSEIKISDTHVKVIIAPFDKKLKLFIY